MATGFSRFPQECKPRNIDGILHAGQAAFDQVILDFDGFHA